MDPSPAATLLEQFLSLARSKEFVNLDAVECDDERWTYGDLDTISTGLALEIFATYGSHPTVAVVSENHPYVLAIFLAVWKLGGIVAPIDSHTPKDILNCMLLDIKPTCGLVPNIETSIRLVLTDLSIPLLPFDPAKTTITALTQRFIDQSPNDIFTDMLPLPHSIALYLHTSSASSTSNIKCVPLTHETILSGCRARLKWWKKTWPQQNFERLVVLGWSPWSHIIGVSHDLGAATLLTAGCYVFALIPSAYGAGGNKRNNSFDVTSQLLDTAVKKRPTAFAGVPWILEGLMSKWKAADAEFGIVIDAVIKNFKIFGSGGAATSEESLLWAKAVGLPLVIDIGMTEIGGPLFHSTTDGTIGWRIEDCLIPDSEIALIDDDGSVSLSEGELYIFSSIIGKGYLRPNHAAFTVAADGRVTLRSGDIYQLIEGERLIWRGRKEDFVQMVSGETLDPRDVEKTLNQCAAIQRSAIVGDNFSRSASHLVYAIVELSAQDAGSYQTSITDVTRAISRVNRSLPPPLRISWSRVLILSHGQHLPLTKKGTLFRKRLEDDFGAQVRSMLERSEGDRLPAPTFEQSKTMSSTFGSTQFTEEEIGDIVCDIVSKALKIETAILNSNPDATFAELGMDSAMATMIVNQINKHLSLTMPLNTCHTHLDLAALTQAIFLELGLVTEADVDARSRSTPGTSKDVDEVVIVGQALRLPGDINTPDEFWKALLDKREDIIRPVPADRWDHKSFYRSPDSADPEEPCDITLEKAGFIDIAHFDHAFFGISSAEAYHVAPNIRLTMEIAFEALENANITLSSIRGSTMGVFVAANMDEGHIKLLFAEKGWGAYTRFYGTGVATSTACGRLSYLMDVHGPSFTIDTACSSGLVGFDSAVRYLQSGQGESAIVCGANTHSWPGNFGFLSAQKMTSPNSRCATFTNFADGYVPSEGAAAVVLKTKRAALRDGDKILALVRSTSAMHDGRSQGLVAPNVKAQIAMQRSLLAQASLSPSQIDFIEAHGTGTSLGDLIEIQGINEVFKASHPPNQPLIVGAAKTCVGHTETVSGLIGLLKAIASFSNSAVPGLVHLTADNMNPSLDCTVVPIHIPHQATPLLRNTVTKQPFRSMILSNGFAGSIAGTIIEEPPRAIGQYTTREISSTTTNGNAVRNDQADEGRRPDEYPRRNDYTSKVLENGHSELQSRRIGSNGSHTNGHSSQEPGQSPNLLPSSTTPSLDDASTAVASPHLFVVSAKSMPALRAYVQTYILFCRQAAPEAFHSICYTSCIGREHYRYRFACLAVNADDLIGQMQVWLSSSTATSPSIRSILFGFPGQGSQYQGMARDLGARFPAFRKILEKAASQASELVGFSVLPYLLKLEHASPRKLSESDVAQICIFVYQCSISRWLQDLGLLPSAVLGQSFGEIAAAVVAGVFTFEAGLKFVAKRASVLRADPSRPAGMAAVATDETTVNTYLHRLSLHGVLTIAVYNGPESLVLSGQLEAIDTIVSVLKADGFKAMKLDVNQAFHSPYISPALPELEGWLHKRSSSFSALQMPFFSTALGREIPRKQMLDTKYWIHHAQSPVLFTQAAEAVVSNNSLDVIIDIGPQPFIWTSLQTSRFSSKHSVSMVAKRGRNQSDAFLTALGRIWAGGATVDFARLLLASSFDYVKVNLPTYPFQRTHNYPTFLASRHSAPLKSIATPTANLQLPFVIDQALCNTLDEHRIEGRRVVPGAALADFFAQAAPSKCVESIRFHQPLVVEMPDDGALGEIDHAGAFVLNQGGSKVCSGNIGTHPSRYVPKWNHDESIPDQIMAKPKVYACFKNVQFGVPFRNIHEIKIWKTHADAIVSVMETRDRAHDRIRKLDACMHMFGAIAAVALPQLGDLEGAFLPASLHNFCLFTDDLPPTFLVQYQLPVDVGRNSQVLSVAMQVFSLSGQLLLSCQKYSVAFIPAGVAVQKAPPQQPTSWLQHHWIPTKCPPTSMSAHEFDELLYLGIGPQPSVLRYLKETATHTAYVELSTLANDHHPPIAVQNAFRGTKLSILLDVSSSGAMAETSLQSALCHQVLSFMKLFINLKVQISSFIMLSSLSLPVDLLQDPAFASSGQVSTVSCQSIIHGMLRVFRRETGLDNVMWGLDLPDLSQMQDDTIKDIIIREMEARRQGLVNDSFVAYRHQRTSEDGLVRLVPALELMKSIPITPRISGVAVIVGMGSIGVALASALLSHGCETVVFLGRRQPTSRSVLEEFALLDSQTQKCTHYRQADVCNQRELKIVMASVQLEFGNIKHIIHTAAVVNDAVIPNVSPIALQEVLQPKVQGSWNLHVVSQQLDLGLDSFVVLSSTNVLVGNPGQLAYVAANSFLDCLACHRHNAGLPGISLQLGAWESRLAENLDMEKSFALLMSHKQGIPLILNAMAVKVPLQVIAEFDIAKLQSTPAYANDPLFAAILPKASATNPSAPVFKKPVSKSTARESALVILRAVMELKSNEDLELNNSLTACGADSITFAQLRGRILKELAVDLPMMFLGEAYTLGDIIQFIVTNTA